MRKEDVVFPTDWDEPAHPMVLRYREDLIAIYTRIKEFQKTIDEVFDDVSKQIGFIVTTSIPVIFDVGEKGKVKSVQIAADNLKGTLFDQGITKAIRGIIKKPIPSCTAGKYNVYLFWLDALKLRLRRDWVEPAHVLRRVSIMDKEKIVFDHKEPAHWFDPGIPIAAEDVVLISVINDVYPELRLEDRIAFNRRSIREEVLKDMVEPVHYRPQFSSFEDAMRWLRRGSDYR